MIDNCKICARETKLWMSKLFDDRHGFPGFFDVYKCKECGFAGINFKTNKKKNADLYKNYYPRQKIDVSKINKNDYQIGSRFKLWRKGLLFDAQHWVESGSSVLDVGCGLGFSLMELENMGCKAFGLDPDVNVSKIAKKLDLNIKVGTMEDKLFKNKKFDYVIANQVLEHVEDPIEFLKLCKNQISANGRIILSFPNSDSLTRKMLGKNWLHWHAPYHLNHFNRKSIKILAGKVGLKIISTKTVSPNLWTALQLRRLAIPRKMGERDMFWDGGEDKKQDSDKTTTENNFRRYFRLIEEYFLPNRLVDFLQMGESFLITFSR
jgi:2-polyprenyl-3-methyl-5-hydroxy-6-metoxy-1,4-benzoquinol methylase